MISVGKNIQKIPFWQEVLAHLEFKQKMKRKRQSKIKIVKQSLFEKLGMKRKYVII